MDPPPEEQKASVKVRQVQKRNSENNQKSNGQIDLKNTNSMQNNQSSQNQMVRSVSIGAIKTFEYSLNLSYSLPSHLSMAQKIEQIKGKRDETFRSDGQMSFNQNSQPQQKAVPLLEPNDINRQEDEENIQKGNFMKLKSSSDALEPNLTQQPMDEKKNQQRRKSYTSCLYPIADKNYLQSHKRDEQKIQYTEETKQESKELILSNNIQEQPYQQNDGKTSQSKDNGVQIEEPNIKPIAIVQKKNDKQDSSPQSPVTPITKKKARQQLQIRRIPSDLYESYDQLLLTVNGSNKISNKDNIISPIKLKQKHNHNLAKKKSKQNDDSPKENGIRPNHIQNNLKNKNQDQQLLVSFPVVEGYCQLKTDNSQIFETKFIINKNTICFQTFKKVVISGISKIKLIEKEDKEITVKITYEPETNSKPQNFLINLLTESSENYFSQSYQLFSHIILRKLLLMKLYINELNEKYEVQSPLTSPQSSPLSSPMTLPKFLPRKALQQIQTQNQGQKLLESNLYKKSTFFSSWEKKYFALTTKNLLSYASSPINGQKQKSTTELSKTSQIWTRFELTYGYLVIKMWQKKIEKFQIGIPLCDFTNPQGKNNWLYGLSKNILWKKHSTKQQKSKTMSVN